MILAFPESMNMAIWVVGTSNQLLITDPYTETNFQKNKVDTGKTMFFVIGPFCIPHSIHLNICVKHNICCAFNYSTFNYKTAL